jgi:hopanoid biosynthesis associated RND transporter like protein HpnN
MERLSLMIGWLVAVSCRRARSVVALTLITGLLAAAFAITHFSVHTEMAALIPADVPWRTHEQALENAFVEQGDDITVVIDARTPEAAEAAAARLTAALGARTDIFRGVDRPGAGPYFQREGLLFLPTPQVRSVTEALIKAQPLLAAVAGDQSLRGVLTGVTTASDGVAAGQASPEAMARPLEALAAAAGGVLAGKQVDFSWGALINGEQVGPGDTRQLVQIYPKLDHGQVRPGLAGLAVVRAEARRLGLDPAHGIRLRLTGQVAMEADELATLGEATGPLAVLALVVVLAILRLAVGSVRIVAPIIATVLVGLALTAAFGLAVYGRFNLISVAFLPLFVGLGVDFAIQYCVRFSAEAVSAPDMAAALVRAGERAGRGLMLAAGATGLSFFAFLPTRYRGVSELGLTAGAGMGIAVLLAVTFLPALLTLSRASRPAAEVGIAMLRGADRQVQTRRRFILAAAALLGLCAVVLSPRLVLNFDPLRLRDPRSESVATFLELARDPDTGPNGLDALAPNLGAARAMAVRLRGLPQAREVYDVDSLVPADQPAKLALISDAALLLDTAVNPFDIAAAPSDADLVASLKTAVQALRSLAASPNGAALRSAALRLAGDLETLGTGPPAARARLQEVLVAGLPTTLERVRNLLSAQSVNLDTLPAGLKAQWLTADGRARVHVTPRADAQNKRGVAAFVREVRGAAPDATGTPIAVAQSQSLILQAFGEAGLLSVVTIALLLGLVLRSTRAVALTLAPVFLSGVLSAGTCVLLGLDLNLENLIALPLLAGVGVSFNIYFVVAWLNGERALLGSSLTRAVAFSALATGAGFGTLSLSKHPGTASMGGLLLISLAWTLVVTLLVQPALLGVFAKAGADDRQS